MQVKKKLLDIVRDKVRFKNHTGAINILQKST